MSGRDSGFLSLTLSFERTSVIFEEVQQGLIIGDGLHDLLLGGPYTFLGAILKAVDKGMNIPSKSRSRDWQCLLTANFIEASHFL
jgi:hypothetical protein